MNVFISGGCKNGKSRYAQEVAHNMAKEKNLPLYYLATMIPQDAEDDKRIKRHLKEREGWGFETIEQGRDILKTFEKSGVAENGIFLVDSVTAILQNEMFVPAANGEWEFNESAPQKVAAELEDFASKCGGAVFVSDYIYSDAGNFDNLTEKYIEGLAFCDRTLAKICDEVIEVVYAKKIKHKG